MLRGTFRVDWRWTRSDLWFTAIDRRDARLLHKKLSRDWIN